MLESSMDNKLIRVFILGLFVFASSLSAAGGDTGTVISTHGTVTAKVSGQYRPLKSGDEFFINARIITGDKSFVVLQFEDGASLTLLQDSAVVIESYRYNATEQDAAILRLESGGLRFVAGAMAKSNPAGYKVRTPVALMVIRGPEFAISLCGNQICIGDRAQY